MAQAPPAAAVPLGGPNSETRQLHPDGRAFSETFPIRCYEVGPDSRASVITVANLLQARPWSECGERWLHLMRLSEPRADRMAERSEQRACASRPGWLAVLLHSRRSSAALPAPLPAPPPPPTGVRREPRAGALGPGPVGAQADARQRPRLRHVEAVHTPEGSPLLVRRAVLQLR